MLKVCDICGLKKKRIAFKNNSATCKKCKVKKQVEKSRKFANSKSLGIRHLNKDGDIRIIHKFFKPTIVMSFEKALEYIQKSPYIVYDETTVYLKKFIKPEKEDVLLRINVLERDNYTCQYCYKDADTVDHIIPKSKGGQFTWNNLTASCKECNESKKDNLISKNEMRGLKLEEKISNVFNKKKWE